MVPFVLESTFSENVLSSKGAIVLWYLELSPFVGFPTTPHMVRVITMALSVVCVPIICRNLISWVSLESRQLRQWWLYHCIHLGESSKDDLWLSYPAKAVPLTSLRGTYILNLKCLVKSTIIIGMWPGKTPTRNNVVCTLPSQPYKQLHFYLLNFVHRTAIPLNTGLYYTNLFYRLLSHSPWWFNNFQTH